MPSFGAERILSAQNQILPHFVKIFLKILVTFGI